ncbi:protein mono-ADP-ribosyltransferase PARP14-like isoform X2 [Cheilinus undulatus]|uniref:protein mono-ADP-ribosyltransferase PARP14-like isoform X2 n=1 Tax=Cheilinus undulatus TaxID=241271 RepID=UPI001BD2AFB0|nr:protein mono-ADP-ribosyltransferase PARP14-like isoform X2 [Cheilinus undulatus]
MEDSYPFPVFFECDTLREEHKNKIAKYFQIRRKSGGGDCGPVTNIGDKVYSIAFREEDAQQRVLQKSEHELELAGVPLKLIVRSNPASRGKPMSPTVDLSLSQFQKLTLTSSSPSVEVHELHLEKYLLRYLKECPKANKQLEEELTSVSCTAQLFPEEGKVLVRSSAQPTAAHDVADWKAEAVKVFDGYSYYYEGDIHKVKALCQSYSSLQTTADVKVYTEGGMAVVVGKCSHVNAMVKDAGDVHKQGTRSSKKQRNICRLGKAKVGLLWEMIEHSLGQDLPQVKVTQGDVGQIVLEGSLEEILKAKEFIANIEKMVLQRTVSDMSPHLLAFLRKAYAEPGMLVDFLGVGDKVEVELGDAELRIFTLSGDKLGDIEKKLHEKFKEDNIYIPNCATVPLELQEQLRRKATEMNKGQCRAQVTIGLDNKLCLLGHIKEFEELSEVVHEFILDQSCIEGTIFLPFPELVRDLSELLQLHKFDYSGITIQPLTNSFQPAVVLGGPSGKVTEVRNQLGPFLDSLSQDRVTIDMPGAGRYFQSPFGRETLLSAAYSQKCLIQLPEQLRSSRQDFASGTVATYSLCGGLKVLVCQGDITKQEADAIVNAANERLDHGGGVAGALSKAGGPLVQKESTLIVRQTGKIPTGEVVVTTGGDLKCKKLLHAVGPTAGKSGGRERALLEKAVLSALGLAELMDFRSIAMPCISSGIFGVPVPVCSEAIVTAVKKFGSEEGRSLNRIVLIDNRDEVVRAMQEACDRLLQGQDVSGGEFQRNQSAQDEVRGATAALPGDGVKVQIIQGTIESQQADYLVCPMSGHDPLSTRVGHCFSKLVGPQLTAKFYHESGGATLPGATVLVEDLPGLLSKGVIFINLFPWDNNRGTAVQVLRQAIKKILATCGIRGCSSVALPVLGTGAVLGFPHSVAAKVLLEEIQEFEQNRISSSSFLIRTVIHSSDKESSKAFQSAQEKLHLRGFTNDANPNQASFYRHVAVSDDEVTAMLGGVKLQMVNGDITREVTDVIVNTTDFSNQSGVSKAIVTAAGPAVQAELARVGIPPERYCSTGPGFLGCTEIIHASFFANPEVIRKNCKNILKHCESKGYSSASFPAINTGAAGVDFTKACKAMLDGMTSSITELKPKSLSLIRIVILEQPVFQAFRSELERRFGLTANRHLSMREKAGLMLAKWQNKKSRTSTASASEDKTFHSFKPPPAVISVISCGGPDTIRTIKRDLEGVLQKQLVERDVDVHDFSRLEPMELEAVQSKVRALGLSLEYRRRQGSEGLDGNRAGNAARAETRDRSGSGREVYVLRGLKEDVLTVIELINRAIQKALSEDLQDKEEAMLALDVQWSIQDKNETWKELSLHDNYVLEQAHLNQQVSEEVTGPEGMKVRVNLMTRDATDWITGTTYKVKRSKTEAPLELPPNWEPMENELFKKVELKPTSQEYQIVAQGFLRTAKFNICKIERVQNYYLWHAYSVCRQRIFAKNGLTELGEMSLYHGTKAESCNCIERDKFDRGYAGTNAAAYGKGVYFAVNANYSASRFSPADTSGLKRLYVARVLTGRYTVGNSSMKAAPPRASDPTDCYDSVVDNQKTPSMFVIFHDDQAYPEYLITFR